MSNDLNESDSSGQEVCKYCGGLKELRNPSGRCDHLYWPDNLTVEAKLANGYRAVQYTRWEIPEEA
jgi:hypothetical protein